MSNFFCSLCFPNLTSQLPFFALLIEDELKVDILPLVTSLFAISPESPQVTVPNYFKFAVTFEFDCRSSASAPQGGGQELLKTAAS